MATPCRDSGARTDALATSAKMRAASRIRTGPFFATRGGSRVVGTGVRGDAYQIDMRTGTIPGILIGSSSLVMASLLSACAPQSLLAQGDLPWNGERALSLVGQARDLRRATQVDSVFQSYQADARGYVYFFLDRPDNDERTLVKTDQVALEIYWKAPRYTKQRLVGLRDEKQLPTNIRYHLDHLTVVQDDFGDRIRLGDGDEVESVVHPVAPGAELVYDFRLRDSLSVSLPGPTPDIRVYEVEVRPKNPEVPGVIGSVFLQRGTGAIVRMNFTFTPASYVDDNLDYIRISMDNSVWDQKYWLPYRQEVEIRRELPIIEFLAGSVIRGRFEIRNYQFNPELPPRLFFGGRVSTVPEAAREAFPFETGLYDQLREEGLESSAEIDAIREQAVAAVGRRYVSGLNPSRLYVPSVSSIYRYDRAEASFAGISTATSIASGWRLQAQGGYAFGREKGHLALHVLPVPSSTGVSLRLGWNELNDVSGRLAGASTLVNTAAGLVADQDFTDPYFTSGAEVRYRRSLGATGSLDVAGSWGRHRSGRNVVDAGVGAGSNIDRPVLAINEGDDRAVEVTYATHTAALGFAGSATGRVGRFDDQPYASLWWNSTLRRPIASAGTSLEARVRVGIATEAAPIQSLFLLGGRHTLIGYSYRSFIGNRVGLLRLEASRAVIAPWITARVFGAAGITGFGRNGLPDAGWLRRSTDGLRTSAGAGVNLGWDLLHFDVGRGLNRGGEWEFLFSIQHRFWAWL